MRVEVGVTVLGKVRSAVGCSLEEKEGNGDDWTDGLDEGGEVEEGPSVGDSVGTALGSAEGVALGRTDGTKEGRKEGSSDGLSVHNAVGIALGNAVGTASGTPLGQKDGASARDPSVGPTEGLSEEVMREGARVPGPADREGLPVGPSLGCSEGDSNGTMVIGMEGDWDGL